MCLRYDVSCVSVDLFWDGPLRSPTECEGHFDVVCYGNVQIRLA